MRALPWIVGGGAFALGAYLWPARREAPVAGTDDDGRMPGQWVWPIGVWRDRKPEISDGFDSRRPAPSGATIAHGGVDLMYRRRPGDPWYAGTPNGSPGWVMPDRRAALAASDGVVWYADKTPRGYSVILDHTPRKIATYYTHLSALLVRPKQAVRAGQPIGVIGGDPLDAAHLMHLHFEVWRGNASTRFDPAPFMRRWAYLPDPGDAAPVLVARNP